MSPLEKAKERLTVSEVGSMLFPRWKSGRACKSPFREDRHPSFSVFSDGMKWKDHATDEGGDAVDFIAKARGLTKSDAAKELISMAGGRPSLPAPIQETAALSRPNRRNFLPMPAGVADDWEEGIEHLLASPKTQSHIEGWRSWPVGTVAMLAEGRLIACPLVRGQRGTAFPVQLPFVDEFGIIGTLNAGFHFRHEPDEGERAKWTYHPSGIPAVPFVLGAGFVLSAQTLIICEGQWDAITLCAAAGWLAPDTSWPEHLAVLGLRGAGTWRALLDTWGQYWPKSARFVLLADNDKAGSKWREPGNFKDSLAKQGHPVRFGQLRGVKDLNDFHRTQPITAAAVSRWINFKGVQA